MSATTIWDQVLTLIEGKVGPHSFSTWFKPTTLKADQGRGGSGIVTPRRAGNGWLAERDITLGRNIPGYPSCTP